MDKTVCKMQWIKNALYLNVSDASVSSVNPISTVLFYFDQFYLRPIKNNVIFEYVLWGNVWFCLIFIVCVLFSHKTKKSWS